MQGTTPPVWASQRSSDFSQIRSRFPRFDVRLALRADTRDARRCTKSQ
jgi:hypothetical protein